MPPRVCNDTTYPTRDWSLLHLWKTIISPLLEQTMLLVEAGAQNEASTRPSLQHHLQLLPGVVVCLCVCIPFASFLKASFLTDIFLELFLKANSQRRLSPFLSLLSSLSLSTVPPFSSDDGAKPQASWYIIYLTKRGSIKLYPRFQRYRFVAFGKWKDPPEFPERDKMSLKPTLVFKTLEEQRKGDSKISNFSCVTTKVKKAQVVLQAAQRTESFVQFLLILLM